MPYNSKAFGIVVSRMRVQKNMTQEQLSGLTGIARSHLAALEGGQKNPGIETIWKLAEALSVTGTAAFIMARQPYAGIVCLTILVIKGILIGKRKLLP